MFQKLFFTLWALFLWCVTLVLCLDTKNLIQIKVN